MISSNKIQGIIQAVFNKYADEGLEITPTIIQLIYNDVGAVFRGLKDNEAFLHYFEVDFDKKIIICHNTDALKLISLLPYQFKRLRGKRKDEEIYIVFLKNGDLHKTVGACTFIDTSITEHKHLGFDFELYESTMLGFIIAR